MSPLEILEKYWRFSAFREKQEDIINAVINGNDTFALLPTGGGKSICYQVPALILDGVCFVVSPLIALMRDQVQQLKMRGISATYLYGGLSKKEIAVELENIRNNKYKLVYVSPERLQSKAFKQNFKRTKVSFLAVDEAHCISQWGHDFRPEFREIATIKELVPDLTILALTASATPKVQQDIVERLELNNPIHISKSFYRSNLHYEVKYEEDKRTKLLSICKSNQGSGIVYVRTRRKTVDIAKLLQEQNIKADFYHGGLTNQERNVKQDNWTKGHSTVMVATNAFGMGIDKPDVRFVAHFDLPDSIESYYQEAGRAGRDGEEAHCILLYEESDIKLLRKFAYDQYPSIDRVSTVYNSLCNFFELAYNSGLDARFDFYLPEFCEKFELKAIEVYGSIKMLQKLGYIHMSEGIHRPSKIKINVTSTQLYDFQLRYPQLDGLIKTVLRSYSGIYDYYTKINERQIAQRSNKNVNTVVSQLKQLADIGVWTYTQASEKPFVTFLQPRKREIVDIEGIIDISKERTLGRIESLVTYIEDEDCRSRAICNYFGEVESAVCEVCDLCKMRHNLKSKHIDFKNIEAHVMTMLADKPIALSDLISNSTQFERDAISQVVNWLLADKKVMTDKSGYLQLSK